MINTERSLSRVGDPMLDTTLGWVLLWAGILACPVVFWVALWFLVPGGAFLTLLGLPIAFALLVIGIGALRSRPSHKKSLSTYSSARYVITK